MAGLAMHAGWELHQDLQGVYTFSSSRLQHQYNAQWWSWLKEEFVKSCDIFIVSMMMHLSNQEQVSNTF
jgi:hypothetical protein